MFGLLVLLGFSVYFLLTSALPIHEYPRPLNNLFGANNLSSSHAVVTDSLAGDYLTLLSAPFDTTNPNPVDRGYVHDDSDGAGTTIFVLDSGFNLEEYPEEQCLDQRRIDTWLLRRQYRSGFLTEDEINDGFYYVEDSIDDTAVVDPDGLFHGHGTQVSIVAGGCKTGVARKANLYLVKIMDTIMHSGLAARPIMAANALVYGLHHVLSVLLGSQGTAIPKGKAIILICTTLTSISEMKETIPEQKLNVLEHDYKTVLAALDRQGVTVIMAAGNNGGTLDPEKQADFVPQYVDEAFPQVLATVDSPLILVGSTNNKGQLSFFSSPGRGNTPVTLYAQGEDITSYDLLHGTEPQIKFGTSYSAPIVAGLAAYILGLPSNHNLCPYRENPGPGQDSVGMCMKKYLTWNAFQRVESNNLLAEDPSEYKYDIPKRVLVVTNGASEVTEEGGGEDNGGDPTPCWSEDTRNQCKIANMTDI